MTSRSQWRNYVLYTFEDQTGETVASDAAYQFSDDFVGAGHSAGIPAAGSPVAGYPWVKKLVGTPTGVALVANGSLGQVACALAATSEAEEASLYWNDNLSVDTTKYGSVEFRAALSVLPSAAGVAAALGVGSAWVGGPLNLARYALFYWAANGTLQIQTKDGTGNTVSIATVGITTDTAMHTYRIDFGNPADIAFWVDGNRVNAVGSVTWAATGANAVLQPWMTVYKPSGTGVATLTTDKIDIFSGR
jgi:hypothetical protein